MQSLVPPEELTKLNDDVKQRGRVDREHLMSFLKLIPSNDGNQIIQEVQAWLRELHANPEYDKINFPGDDINAVISDLDSYGRVHPATIMKFKAQHSKEVKS